MGSPTLEDIRPWSLGRVIDLVEAAGVDVSDWANFSRGAKYAAANPRYCYEWAFQGNGRVVLNLWFEDMQVRNGEIVCEGNIRSVAARLVGAGTKAMVRKRAEATDDAIRNAYDLGVPVRVIVCRGKRAGGFDPSAQASKVRERGLDPMPWAVRAYDHMSGRYLIVRGASPQQVVDQFDLPEFSDGPTERRSLSGQRFVRDSRVRKEAMRRAAGHCEWCGQPGFSMPDGRVFLETHHVVPLGEDGPDRLDNVAALCPNHHREAHHGQDAEKIRQGLLRRLRGRSNRRGTNLA